MNDPTQMMNRSFGIWPQGPPMPLPAAEDPMIFQTLRPMFPQAAGSKPGRVNWKVKKAADKRNKAAAAAAAGGSCAIAAPGGGAAGGSGFKPPTLNELQFQNRVKARRFYPKKKFTRFAPLAPRNTTSFIIRAKKSGGIASLVSPCPVTPAILPTPKFSPSREGLVDMAKEEWGVDGYGSMKGLIRLRSDNGAAEGGDEDEGSEDGSSGSDVEEHLEVERRLDHDLSRFEMVYPSSGEDQGAAVAAAYLLENRVDDQDSHIVQLEDENLTLKERLFWMEREMVDLRRRLQLLETKYRGGRDGINNNDVNNNNNNIDNERSYSGNNNMNAANEEASENASGGGDVCSDADQESKETQMMEECEREGGGGC